MSVPIVTIFGGSGFIGRQVAQRMARAGWRVRVAVRRPEEAGFVRPYGFVGQVEPIQANIRDEASTRAAIVGIVAAVDIPIVHFSVEWWRGLHQTATIASPERVLDPAAPMVFVGTLLGTLAAFSLAWAYLMIRRYQLARAELAREEAVRVERLMSARAGRATTEAAR